MGILGSIVIAYVTFGIPIGIMFWRAGMNWTWSLLVLIPIFGIPIALLILVNREWQPRRSGR